MCPLESHAYPQNDCLIVTNSAKNKWLCFFRIRNIDSSPLSTPKPPPATPKPPPATPKGNPSGECKRWCAGRPRPWVAKCTFKNMCDACPECGGFSCAIVRCNDTYSELGARVVLNGCVYSLSDPNQCCGFFRLRNIDSLPPATTKGKSGGVCKQWCPTRPLAWSVKCGFGDCGGCLECGVCVCVCVCARARFSCVCDTIMHIHATIVELSLAGALTRSLRFPRVL